MRRGRVEVSLEQSDEVLADTCSALFVPLRCLAELDQHLGMEEPGTIRHRARCARTRFKLARTSRRASAAGMSFTRPSFTS